MVIGSKRVLWAIDVYTRVNHLRVGQELIRKTYGSGVDIVVYTGNELFDLFPDEVFRYKEDMLVRVPDDPKVHFLPDGCNHAGSHNGHRDACNYVSTICGGHDYVVWTVADCIFSDYAAVEKMLRRMDDGGHAFMSCVSDFGAGRATVGPRVHNEFFVATGEFFREMFPMRDGFEGHDEDGRVRECFERGMGDRVREKLAGRSWLVVPGYRHELAGQGNMQLEEGLGRISVENLFKHTVGFMERYSPENLAHCNATCLKDGWLYDRRPNYDPA